MLHVCDHDRQTMCYEVHDGLAQLLAAADIHFQLHESLRSSLSEGAEKAYHTGVELVRQAHVEAHRLIRTSRSSFIDEIGLVSAISQLIDEHRKRGGPKIEFHCTLNIDSLPSPLVRCLYRMIQEALTNACKYSQSERVAVTLIREGLDVLLEVQDWGVGFDPGSVEKGHFGLEGMYYRARILGGRLTIHSTPSAGTLIQAVLPVPWEMAGTCRLPDASAG